MYDVRSPLGEISSLITEAADERERETPPIISSDDENRSSYGTVV